VIRESWSKSTAGIIETGQLLLQARDELDRDVFRAMRLPFGRRTAQRLMAIAANSILATHVSSLPPSWGTLYELTKLSDQALLTNIETGSIHPDMQRKDVAVLLNKPKQVAAKPQVEVSLQSVWAKASTKERAEFCDAVGIAGFSAVWSLEFYRQLIERIRIEKFEAQPSVKLTKILATALSHLVSASEPGSDDIVRKANLNAALNALGVIQKIVVATGGKAEAALSLVPAGTLNRLRDRLKKQTTRRLR
jgi:hypothetical protein